MFDGLPLYRVMLTVVLTTNDDDTTGISHIDELYIYI